MPRVIWYVLYTATYIHAHCIGHWLIPGSEIGRGSGQLILARPFKAGKNDRPSVRVTAVTLDFTRR